MNHISIEQINKNQINAITRSYKKYNNVLDNYIRECDPFCTIYKPKNLFINHI